MIRQRGRSSGMEKEGAVPTKLLSSLGGRLLLSVAIGIFVVSVATISFSLFMRRPLDLADEMGVIIAQIVMVSLPFIVISLLGAKSSSPWLVGLGMTATIWVIYIFDAWSRSGSGSGANIGLGLLLLVSPIIILGVCIAFMRRDEKRAQSPASDT